MELKIKEWDLSPILAKCVLLKVVCNTLITDESLHFSPKKFDDQIHHTLIYSSKVLFREMLHISIYT